MDFLNNAVLNFGRLTNSALYFNGTMDEARIQSGLQSSDWVWASWATVASNSVLQNYSAVVQQAPALGINAGAGGITLSWAGSGVGFVLCTTTNLASPAAWSPATNQPTLVNGQWQINLPPDNSSTRFYRLQSQ